MLNNKSFIKYSMIVTITLIISKVLGFGRELVIAAMFGATRESDIYKIVTTIPNSIFSCVAAALVTTFIPVFTKIKNDKDKSDDFFSNILNIIILLCSILSILGIIFSPFLTRLFTNFKGNDFNRTASLTRIVMPTIIFLGLSGLYTGYLQSHGIFLQPAMTGIASDIVIIVGILLFRKQGINAAIIAFLLSSVAQVLIQRPFVKNFKYKLKINFKDPYIKSMVLLGTPILISTLVSQVNTIVDRRFASSLIAGSISVIDDASKISTLINQVFIFSITTVMYPMLTERFQNNDMDGFKDLLNKTINIVFIVAIPLIMILINLSLPIVKLLLEHGKFDSNASNITSSCLIYLAASTLGYALIDAIGKIFFATKQTIIPMINGFILVGLNIFLIFMIVPRVGVVGLAIANTISALTIGFILLIELHKKLKAIKIKNMLMTFIKVMLSSAIISVIVNLIYNSINKVFISNSLIKLAGNIFVSSAIGIVLYIVLLIVFKVDEVKMIFKLKKKAV